MQVKGLEKAIPCTEGGALEPETKDIHTLLFPVPMYGRESLFHRLHIAIFGGVDKTGPCWSLTRALMEGDDFPLGCAKDGGDANGVLGVRKKALQAVLTNGALQDLALSHLPL